MDAAPIRPTIGPSKFNAKVEPVTQQTLDMIARFGTEHYQSRLLSEHELQKTFFQGLPPEAVIERAVVKYGKSRGATFLEVNYTLQGLAETAFYRPVFEQAYKF